MKSTLVKVFLFCCVIAHGQVAKYSNEFLNIGVDASAFGQSSAVVASTDNVNAGYWNPAGLLHLEKQQVSLMHASYFANIANYDYVAYAQPIDETSAFAISMIRFGVDDIMDTTKLIQQDGTINYNNISLFSAADYAFTLSYAKDLKVKNLHFGANFKIVRRIIGDFAKSWGFGFDAGLQYSIKKWQLGLMVRDITTTVNTWSIDEEKYQDIKNAIPGKNQEAPETSEITKPKIQLGIARTFMLKPKLSLKTELDLNMRLGETNDLVSSSVVSLTPAYGMELGYNKLVFLRAGVGNFQEVTQLEGGEKVSFQPNLGLGFHYKGVSVDYALTNLSELKGTMYSNVFSLNVDLSVFGIASQK